MVINIRENITRHTAKRQTIRSSRLVIILQSSKEPTNLAALKEPPEAHSVTARWLQQKQSPAKTHPLAEMETASGNKNSISNCQEKQTCPEDALEGDREMRDRRGDSLGNPATKNQHQQKETDKRRKDSATGNNGP